MHHWICGSQRLLETYERAQLEITKAGQTATEKIHVGNFLPVYRWRACLGVRAEGDNTLRDLQKAVQSVAMQESTSGPRDKTTGEGSPCDVSVGKMEKKSHVLL